MQVDLQKYLRADPAIQHGKVCFRGTRIPVYLVLELLEGGVKPKEIVGKDYYPQLTLQHIQAALHFAVEYAKNSEYTAFEQPAKTRR